MPSVSPFLQAQRSQGLAEHFLFGGQHFKSLLRIIIMHAGYLNNTLRYILWLSMLLEEGIKAQKT